MGKRECKHENIKVIVRDDTLRDRLVQVLNEEYVVNPYEYLFSGVMAIVDSALLSSGEKDLKKIIDAYDYVMVLVRTEDTGFINQYFQKGVKAVIRQDYQVLELIRQLEALFQEQRYGVGKSILQGVFNGAQNSIVITDKEGIIRYANRYFIKETGFESEQIIGGSPELLRSGIHSVEFYKELWETITAGNVWNGVFINRRKNGSLFYEDATITPLKDSRGEVLRYLKIGRIVERENMLVNELRDEVRLAKDIMISMFPPPYEDASISFNSKIRAYNYLGGDFVGFQKLGEGHYVVSLIDVMGHGASSTIIGLKTLTMFEDYCRLSGFRSAVNAINKMVVDFNRDENVVSRYISGVFIEVDVRTGMIDFISAGHPDFVVVNREGQVAFYQSNNLLLGVSAFYEYTGSLLHLPEVANIFFYSDGLIDNTELEYQEMTEKLKLTVEKNIGNEKMFLRKVLEEVVADQEIIDDIALCLLSFPERVE